MTDIEKVIKALDCLYNEDEMPDICPCEFHYGYSCVCNVAKEAIAILKDPDRIKVTRCNDCKHAKEWPFYRNSDRTILCALRDEATKPAWFCADGKRR